MFFTNTNSQFAPNSDSVMEAFSPEIMSKEDELLILEGALLDGLSDEELDAIYENANEYEAAFESFIGSEFEPVMEKSIVKLDKKAKISRAHKLGIYSVAKEKKDPKFKKLVTLWKLVAKLERYLTQKYYAEGLRRAKKSIANASNNKNSKVKKAVNKAKAQLGFGVGKHRITANTRKADAKVKGFGIS